MVYPVKLFMDEITSELLYQTEVLTNMLKFLIWIDIMRKNGIFHLGQWMLKI
jgi:hypothetical protein